MMALAAACWLAAPLRASADTGGAKATAEALFEEGRRLLSTKDYPGACQKFEASQQLDAGIGTLLYLGDCYEKLGRTASAWASFREAESMAEAQGQQKRKQIAQTRADALEPRLAKLLLEVAPSNLTLEGFEVRSNGAVVPPPTFGVEVPLDPGNYDLTAQAPGHANYETSVNLSSGTIRELIPALSPLRPASAAVTAAQPPPPARPLSPTTRPSPEADTGGMSGTRVLSLALAGAGLIGLAAGGVFGAIALDKNAASEDLCRPNDPTRCTPDGVELRDDATRYATWSTVGLSAGGVLLTSGIVLWFTAPKESAWASQRLSLVAGVSPSTAEASIGGVF